MTTKKCTNAEATEKTAGAATVLSNEELERVSGGIEKEAALPAYNGKEDVNIRVVGSEQDSTFKNGNGHMIDGIMVGKQTETSLDPGRLL